MVGSAHDDVLIGNATRNVFTPGEGNDQIDGGAGIDTVIISGKRSEFDLSLSEFSGLWVLSSRDGVSGVDTLSRVERIQFSDRNVALDLDANAGKAARMLATVFGKPTLQNLSYAGVAIDLFDQGLSMDQVAQLAIQVRLGANPKSGELVTLLWKNVMGTEIDAKNLAELSGLLDSKALSPAQLTSIAAEHDLTGQTIDLIGLTKTGWEFSPS